MDLKETGLKGVEEGSDRWRAVVFTVMNGRFSQVGSFWSN
jgi:hypothetical protein